MSPSRSPPCPHDPVAASWSLAAATPGMLPDRQALLESPGAGERLRAVRDTFRLETSLLRSLGASVGGTRFNVNPN